MRRVIVALFALALPMAAAAENQYIPVAGVAPGANNTLFRTDVRIFNPSEVDDIHVSVHFLPQGMDGSNISGRVVHVPKRQMVVLNNIVGDFLKWPGSAIGAIRLDSDTASSYSFVADSRTYTDSPNAALPGTFGQFIPSLKVEQAKTRTVVLHLSYSPDLSTGFRSNVGVMNPFGTARTYVARLHAADGSLIATSGSLAIPPMSMTQLSLPAMFGTIAPFADGFVAVEADAPLFSYASVIDNRSADQIFVLGVEDVAVVTPLP